MSRIKNASYLGRFNNDDLKDFEDEHLIAELHRRGRTYESLRDNFKTLDYVMDGRSEQNRTATQEMFDLVEAWFGGK